MVDFIQEEPVEAPVADEEVTDEPKDILPVSQYKPPAPVPIEEYGHGVNKKVYFVTNECKCSKLCINTYLHACTISYSFMCVDN
jgi:hypothetical protein